MQPLVLSVILYLSISFMCCDLCKREGGVAAYRDSTLPHFQSGPIINTPAPAGGSHGSDTTDISGLWNGGGKQERGRKEKKGGGGKESAVH